MPGKRCKRLLDNDANMFLKLTRKEELITGNAFQFIPTYVNGTWKTKKETITANKAEDVEENNTSHIVCVYIASIKAKCNYIYDNNEMTIIVDEL